MLAKNDHSIVQVSFLWFIGGDERLPDVMRDSIAILRTTFDEASVSHLAKLALIHRDPFDRMLICQAVEHGLTLVTVDDLMARYPVSVLHRA